MRVRLFLAILLISAALPLLSQVAPAAHEGGIPLVVGAGASDFDLDYGSNKDGGRRMEGIAVWVDYYPSRVPAVMRGLGLEIEGREINFGRPSDLTKMRQDTALGGPIYTWRHFSNFHPYAKYLMGFGSIDFPGGPGYTHDTRDIFAPGGGIEYRAYRNIWVRADYEYQFWRQLFGPTDLNPNGITVGASYSFTRKRRR